MHACLKMLALFLLMSIGWLAFTPQAHADNWAAEAAKANKTDQKTTNCGNYVGLTNRIAGCIRETVDAAADRFFTGFYPIVQSAIGAVMTLAVIIYGILLSYGMVEKLGRDTMVLVIKLACVVAFTTSSPMLYKMVTQMMDGASLAAISYTPASGSADAAKTDFTQAKCMQLMKSQQDKSNETGGPSQQKRVVGPWLAMDCLLDTVIGIKVVTATPNQNALVYFNQVLDVGQNGASPQGTQDAAKQDNFGMSRGMLFLFFSGMQTSTVGLILGIVGFIFIWGLIMLIVKALFTYLAGYIGIALMVIVSPLFIPLILFRVTKQYFDKWVKTVISFALQPVLILAFITFSLAAVDFATFAGKYSIWYRIAGEESTKANFDLNTYLSVPRDKDGKIVEETPENAEKLALETTGPIIMKKSRPIFAVKGDKPEFTETQGAERVKVIETDEGGKFRGLKYTNCTKEKIAADTTGNLKKECSASYNISLWTSFLDWEKMAKARNPKVERADGATNDGQQIAREVLSSALFCAFVVFIMNGLLSVLPFMAQDLTGDGGQSTNVMRAVGSNFTGGQNVMSDVASQMRKFTGGRT